MGSVCPSSHSETDGSLEKGLSSVSLCAGDAGWTGQGQHSHTHVAAVDFLLDFLLDLLLDLL